MEEIPRCKRCKHPADSHDEWDYCDVCRNDCPFELYVSDGFFDINGFSRVRIDRGYR